MRYVLITAEGPEHRYVANMIDREVGLSAIVIDTGQPRRKAARLKQLLRRYSLYQLLGRTALAGLKIIWRDKKKYSEELRRVLGKDIVDIQRPEIVMQVQGINTPQGISALRGVEPGRLLIYGTGIVTNSVLELSRQTPLNMHTGISPYYRGDSCAFWPLHQNELQFLGATVHEITATVDGGAIYATGQARLEPNDSLHSVFARCVEIGTELYIQELGKLERGESSSLPQNLGIGKEYRASMRGLFAELKVRYSIRKGLIRQWCEANQDN